MTRRNKLAAQLLAGFLAVGTVTCVTAPVMARQSQKQELTPPVPAPPKNPPAHLLGKAMAFLLGAMVVGVNFIPSKRGHQD